jgi:hypothetical protein
MLRYKDTDKRPLAIPVHGYSVFITSYI